MYQGRRWAFIEEHIHDALGKHSRDAGCALAPPSGPQYPWKDLLEVPGRLACVQALPADAMSCAKQLAALYA